jgi:hypothetical protein
MARRQIGDRRLFPYSFKRYPRLHAASNFRLVFFIICSIYHDGIAGAST